MHGHKNLKFVFCQFLSLHYALGSKKTENFRVDIYRLRSVTILFTRSLLSFNNIHMLGMKRNASINFSASEGCHICRLSAFNRVQNVESE